MRTLSAVLLTAAFLITPLMQAKPRKQRVPHMKGVKAHKAKKQPRHKRAA